MDDSDPREWRPNRSGPWAAIDAGLQRHPKLERLTRAAVGYLYVGMLLHCADELTDGHIAAHAIPRLLLAAKAKKADLDELVANGLLEPTDDGYHVHGYLNWNPTRAHWERQREANARRQQEWRDRQREYAQSERRNPARNGPRNALRNGLVSGEREKYEVNPPNPPTRKCPICGLTLARNVALEDHLRVTHGQAVGA